MADFDTTDRFWMRRALRLAVRSLGSTAPNPGVACVVVRDGRELGAGRHRLCGGPHAEIEALSAVAAAGEEAHGATAYVTLAPCTRQGRTGPCAQALVDAGIARVVSGVADPSQDDPAGLFAAQGIAYAVGCESRLAATVHGGFLYRLRTGRARLTGKWAMTLDGYLAAHTGQSSWISDPEALALSRRRRRAFDGLLVGAGTVRRDDPSLQALDRERSPTPIICSPSADLPAKAQLLSGRRQVVIVHGPQAVPARVQALEANGHRCLRVDHATDPLSIATALGDYGFNDVLVEGGSRLHAAFLAAGVYSRLELYLGARSLGGGLPIAGLGGVDRIADGADWHLEEAPRVLGSTIMARYRSAAEALA